MSLDSGGYTFAATKATNLATPKLTKVENVAGGVKITWGKVAGAAKYRVFYKTGSGKWTKAGDSASTSYTWSKGKSGTKYAFTVRCLSKDGKSYTSGYNTTGKAITYIAAPKVTKLESTATGVKVTWGKVSGAAKYRVFYKKGGKWTKLADTTATSYTWKGAKNGTKYTFTVRCLSKDSKSYTSAFDTAGKSITYKKPASTLATPKLSKVENVAGGVKVTWGKVGGAAKYRVFYKTGSGSWTKAGDSTGTSYTWKKAKSGTKYTFTVRCLSADSKKYTSSYNTTGKAITYIAAPAISKVESAATGVKVTWGKVAGAAKYRVFYKTGSGSWTKAGDTTGTSYTWTKAKNGTKYTFTVRCLSKDSKSYTSAFDATGKAITYKKPASATTASTVAINATNFPDATFRSYVSKNFDKDKNGKLSAQEREAVTKIEVDGDDITTLKGIERFTNLKTLDCSGSYETKVEIETSQLIIEVHGKLTALDVSKNTKLETLRCANNQLTALDVSKNTVLEELNCGNNHLTTLDVSKNAKLRTLDCENNQLAKLDVSKNTKLEWLNCSENQLTKLDVRKNTALDWLSCGENRLTALDVSGATALDTLHCYGNLLKTLDVSKNTALVELNCSSNQLKTLEVSKNTKLEDLSCSSNQLTTLDVSKNTKLKYLYCYDNHLTTLDVSGATALDTLNCYGNLLKTLDVSKNTALKQLFCDNNQLTKLDVSKNTALERFECRNNQLTTLDVSKNNKLTEFSCDSNVTVIGR